MQKWALVSAIVLSCAHASAVQLSLDARALDEAMAIGHSRLEQDRVRFHAPYRLVVGQPPLDLLEVITPFRRVVLASEARARAGERIATHRLAWEAIGDDAGLVELRLELTFHPHHTFVGVPDYEVLVVRSDGTTILPRTIARVARHGPRTGGPLLPVPVIPDPRELALPMTGGTIVAKVDAAALLTEAAPAVALIDGAAVLAQVEVHVRGLR